MNEYFIPTAASETEFTEKRSRFIGHVWRVESEEEARSRIDEMIEESIRENVATYLSAAVSPAEWNIAGLRDHYLGWLTVPTDLRFTEQQKASLSVDDISELLIARAQKILTDKEAKIGSEMMRLVERFSLLSSVDECWMEHIDNMDQLRRSIHLRSYAQHNPVVEYRKEGYAMFDEMVDTIREKTAKRVIVSTIVPSRQTERNEADAAAASGAPKTAVAKKKIGRNDPCPCGSGKKYKNCCGRNQTK